MEPAAHLFSYLFLVRRAFLNIYNYILGDSRPAIALRASVWESIFTNDLRRYRRSVYERLVDIPTLITGPSGTGKELVARAIGLSQYIPFDEARKQFPDMQANRFHALNLSACSPTLIESELFGHAKGAFTGAIAERHGWFAQCQPFGAVFLDEIGELETPFQVKLLRVVQQRTFSRLGETTEQRFAGKLIGATNRDLATEIRAGRFREDLYYRMCSDRIVTPSLRSQLDDRPDDLHALVSHIAKRFVGEQEFSDFADQVVAWIQQNLGNDYPWHGNIRELEQCISSFLIRGSYQPQLPTQEAHMSPSATQQSWIAPIFTGELTAEETLKRYVTWVYHRSGSYEEAARRLGVDRRTVKCKLDEQLLSKWQKRSDEPAQ